MNVFHYVRPATIFLTLEICLSVSAVIEFLSISIGNYRLQAWRNGGAEGWNSDPNKRIYYYANFKEPPPIPRIWTDELSDSTLAISIVNLLSVGICGFCTRLRYMTETVHLLYKIALGCLWVYTLTQQSSGDDTDVEHSSTRPWFLTHSCADAWPESKSACHCLQAGFVLSLIMAALVTAHIVVIIYGLWTTWKLDSEGWHHPETEPGAVARRKGRGVLPEVIDLDNMAELQEHAGMHRIHQQAFSPVLAFFPENPPWRHGANK